MKINFGISQTPVSQKNITKRLKNSFYSPLLSTYFFHFTKEGIPYQVEISKHVHNIIEANLSKAEKEDILFILTTIFQKALSLLKKSNEKQFIFEITFDDTCVTIHVFYSFNPKKSRHLYIKKVFGNRKNFKNIQTIIKKNDRLQLSTNIIENFVDHKLKIDQKS